MFGLNASTGSRRARSRFGAIVLATAVLASSAACGTRESDENIVESLRGPGGPLAPAAAPIVASGTDSSAAVGAAVPGVATPGAPTTGGTTTPAAATTTGGAASPSGSGGTAGKADGGAKAQAPSKSTVADKSPVAIGTLGAFSGVVGAVTAGSPKTIAAWAAYTNSHGGLNGHPVRLVVGDDQGDPATSLTLARRLVESDKVLAFVGNIQFFGFAQVEQYLRSKNIPMVGGDNVDPGWVTSPITFPVAPPVAIQIVKGLKMYADQGQSKMAMLYCLEIGALCQYLNDEAKKSEVGKYLLQNYQVSLVAPSYTSQCLRMKQASIEVVYMLLDTASAARVTKDCATQGYKPKFMLLGLDATAEMPSIPALAEALIPGATVPIGASDLPSVQRYRQAMNDFAPGVGDSGFGALGWAAAELFGLAGKNFSETPTTAELFAGLYTVKNETFGGFTVPLTFTKAKREAKPCVFIWGVANAKFSAPQGSKPLC